MKTRSCEAFSIMELIVVVIIIGVLAGLALPNYSKSVERTHLQDATMQLSTIHAAQSIYYARLGTYWPPDTTSYTINDINTALKLNVIENDMTYTCQGGTASGVQTTYTCQASRNPGASFTVTVTEQPLSNGNPSCSGSCP